MRNFNHGFYLWNDLRTCVNSLSSHEWFQNTKNLHLISAYLTLRRKLFWLIDEKPKWKINERCGIIAPSHDLIFRNNIERALMLWICHQGSLIQILETCPIFMQMSLGLFPINLLLFPLKPLFNFLGTNLNNRYFFNVPFCLDQSRLLESCQ